MASVPSPREGASPGPPVQLDGVRVRRSLRHHLSSPVLGLHCPLLKSCDSLQPHDKHKMLPSPQWFLARTLEAALWCCCAGAEEGSLCATEATDEAVPVHDQNKSKHAIEGFFLPRAASSTLPGLWGVPFSQHMCHNSRFLTTMELLQQDGYWSQSNESHSDTRASAPVTELLPNLLQSERG